MKYLFSILFVLLSGSVLAQNDMTFRAALETLLQNNHAVRSGEYGVDVAYDEMRAARGLRLFNIDIVGGFTLLQRSVDIEFGGAKGLLTESLESLISSGVSGGLLPNDVAQFLQQSLSPIMQLDWRYTLQRRAVGGIGALITMPIYAGGRINSANRMAKLNVDLATSALESVENGLITQLVEYYYGLILAREVVAIREDVVRAVGQHLDDVVAMEEEGVVAHSAVLFMQYQLSEAERNLAEAVSRARVAESALSTVVGVGQSLNPISNLFICDDINPLDYYIDMANQINPLLNETRLAKRFSEEGKNMARADLLPEVIAFGAGSIYNYQLSDMVPRWSVGVGVNFKLFDGLAKERRYLAAKSEVNQMAELVMSAEEEVRLLVEKEYYGLTSSKQSIASAERSIAFAETLYATAKDGFSEGVVASSELIDACVALASSRVEYMDSVYQHCLSLARLLEASGLSSDYLSYADRGRIID